MKILLFRKLIHNWSEDYSYIAFGIIILINHSSEPNWKINKDRDSRTLEFVCIKEFIPGEEFTLYYRETHYPFKYRNVKIF